MKLYTYENNRLTPAPTLVTVDGVTYHNPTQATLRRAGIEAYPKEIDPPMPPEEEGKIVVPNGYALVDGAWVKQWCYEDAPPPPPKAYNRYKIVTALKAEGVWRNVRAAMLAQDEDALDMLYTAEDISEDEPLLLAMIAMLKAAPYNWTDEQVAAILEAARIGGA